MLTEYSNKEYFYSEEYLKTKSIHISPKINKVKNKRFTVDTVRN